MYNRHCVIFVHENAILLLVLATTIDVLSVYPIGSDERFSITCRETISAEEVNDTTHVEQSNKICFPIKFINIYCECIN